MDATTIYKVLPRDVWSAAAAAGQFKGAGIDLADGYIHFSTKDQVVETVEKHFVGQNDLVLVAIDTRELGEKLVWEPSRGGALFPHLYTALPTRTATAVHDLPMNENGTHEFPAVY